VRCFGLRASLPLDLVGDLPLVDESAASVRSASREAIRGLCEFLVDCSSNRPLVLELIAPPRTDPLLAELSRRLVPAGRARRLAGSVLLVVDSPDSPESSDGA
jgi:hypothetical protein